MRIVHISTNDLAGGAARAAYRLHRGLRAMGEDSQLFVARRDSDDASVIAYQPKRSVHARMMRRLRAHSLRRALLQYPGTSAFGYEIFTDDRSAEGAAALRQIPPADVIHLHWIAGLADYAALFRELPRRAPLVWTLHDMNAFTGGCHYDRQCSRYLQSCGECPQLGSGNPDDLSRRIWQRKQDAYAGVSPDRLHIVTPSRWLAAAAAASPLLERFRVTTIPNGVDVREFSPKERSAARASLGLKQESKVVLFAAEWVGHQRKGFSLLRDALAGLSRVPGLQLVSVGKEGASTDGSVPHLALGYVGSERLLAAVYSAADVYVIPSLQDNLPNTVLESLACGTPVVGFDTGGIPEAVRPGCTGLLVPPGDTASLRDAILRVLEDEALQKSLATNARRIAQEEYAVELQARRYLELYRAVLNRRTQAASQATS